jgi:hypothetical protein
LAEEITSFFCLCIVDNYHRNAVEGDPVDTCTKTERGTKDHGTELFADVGLGCCSLKVKVVYFSATVTSYSQE